LKIIFIFLKKKKKQATSAEIYFTSHLYIAVKMAEFEPARAEAHGFSKPMCLPKELPATALFCFFY